MYTHFVMLICTVKCCALCITESDPFLVPKNRGFLKTELLWKPNFRDGPEAVQFSQIILYLFLYAQTYINRFQYRVHVTLAVLSWEPVAMNLSLGDTVMELMSFSWAFSVALECRWATASIVRSDGTSQTLMVQSCPPLTNELADKLQTNTILQQFQTCKLWHALQIKINFVFECDQYQFRLQNPWHHTCSQTYHNDVVN